MLRFNFKQGDSQIRKAKERELNKSCFYYLNRSQVQPYVLGGHCRDFSYTGALKSSSLRFTVNSYLVLLFPHRLSLLDFSICFNYKISFDNINSNIPSADLHQIKVTFHVKVKAEPGRYRKWSSFSQSQMLGRVLNLHVNATNHSRVFHL